MHYVDMKCTTRYEIHYVHMQCTTRCEIHYRSLSARSPLEMKTHHVSMMSMQHTATHCNTLQHTAKSVVKSCSPLLKGPLDMGWLRLVGSFKLQVSFAEYSLFYRALLQKRPIILRSLLIVATPYEAHIERTLHYGK